MFKLLSGCALAAAFFGTGNGASDEEEVRQALQKEFDSAEDWARVEEYLDFVSKFNKLNGIDTSNTDELVSRFLNWRDTDDTLKAGKEQSWTFGHTKFSDWSRDEKLKIVMNEDFISQDSRSAIDAQNCLQVKLTDSSVSSSLVESERRTSYNVDNRAYDVAGIQDQGYCSSCWDFSDVATLEMNRNIDLGLLADDDDSESSFVKLSEQYVLDCVSDDIGSCDGGYPILTLMWVNENEGICASADYNDYEEEESTCSSSSCESSEASLYSELFCLADETDSQVSIAASTFSLVFAFKVYSEFFNYESGVYSCDTSDEFVGWHAVSMVGVTDDYFIVKNSWSTDWGDDGYFYMSKNAFNDCGMSHFSFVSFNDLQDALTSSEGSPEMDISIVQELRTQSQSSKTLVRQENVSSMISKHIKVHGSTSEIILYVLGGIVALSVLLLIIGQSIKCIVKCKDKQRVKSLADFNEESALLDGYVAL